MRISDWSSDVCSSDVAHTELLDHVEGVQQSRTSGIGHQREHAGKPVPLLCRRQALAGHGNPSRIDRMLVPVTATGDLDRLIIPGAHKLVVGHSRSEEHTSEPQSLLRISYAVF